MADTCMFCAEERDVWVAYSCGHTSACYRCGLRVRFKNKNKEKSLLCPECQQKSESIYLFSDSEDRADGADIRDRYWAGVSYESESVQQEVERLVGLCCSLSSDCGEMRTYHKTSDLRNHYLNKHDASFCTVCFDARPMFPAEQTLYTKQELRAHESTTEQCHLDESNFYGHPRCAFCSTLHYDVEALYEHVHQKHFLCDICERHTDKKLVFYRGIGELIQHWREHHYYCEKCHDKHVGAQDHHPTEWVFGTDIDFAAHNTKAHNTGTGRNNRTNVIIMGESSYADARRQAVTLGQNSREEERDGAGGVRQSSQITFQLGRRQEVVHMNLTGNQQAEQSPTSGRGRGKGGKKGGKGDDSQGGRGYGRGRGSGAQQAESAPSPSYQEPRVEGFKERNIQLMNKMKAKFGNNLTKFNQFRVISADFLKGQMQTVDYYEKLELFFAGDFDDIFPDLVELLPDRNKQAGLRLAHNNARSKERGIADPPVPSTAKSLQSKKQQQQQQQQQQAAPSSSSSSAAAGAPSSSGSAAWLSMARGTPGNSGTSGPSADTAEFPGLPGQGKGGKGAKGSKPKPKGSAASSASNSVWMQKALARK